MFSVSKALGAAVLGVALFASLPSYAEDGMFKSSEFLKWERSSQESYIHTAVGMTRLVVGQTSSNQGDCIVNWYSADKDAAINSVLQIMRENPEFDPRGVLLAVMEKKCGKFSYREK